MHLRSHRHDASANRHYYGTPRHPTSQTLGLTKASLSYTYSNLDALYGASGYHISTYYFMGEKTL